MNKDIITFIRLRFPIDLINLHMLLF